MAILLAIHPSEMPSTVEILASYGVLRLSLGFFYSADPSSARATDMSFDICGGHLSDMSMTNVYDKCP